MDETIKTYANQIQVLTSRTAELVKESHRLRDRIDHVGSNIPSLPL